MRFRTLLSAAVVTAAVATMAPAHAEETIYFGTPLVDQRYNDGESGFIALAFGPGDLGSKLRTSSSNRPMGADCDFVIEPSVNSSAITIDVVGHATAGVVADGAIIPASTGVECTVRLGNGTLLTPPVEAADPGAVAVGAQHYVVATGFASPITLCATPSVHWSDNKFQTSPSPYCKTG
jgi:hypothetical protein